MPAMRRGAVVGVAITLVLGTAATIYWKTQNAGLERLMHRAADLPADTPAISFVNLEGDRARVPDRHYVVAGHLSVIVYHQPTCPDCRRLDGLLDRFVAARPDVAVRKINLGERWSADSVRRGFGRERVWWTPFIVIYGPDGSEIAADDGSRRDGWALLHSWIEAELQQANDHRAGPTMRH